MNSASLEATQKQKVIVFITSLAVLLGAGLFLSPENYAFSGVTPHPYLVLSIVLASFYGFVFAITFSSVIGVMYLVLLHLQTDYKSVESLISLQYLSLPILNLIFSSVIGELKSRTINRIRDLELKLEDLNTSTDTLVNKTKNLSTETYDLKKRLVNKLETFKSVLELTKGFQNLDRDKLIEFYFNTVVNEISARDAVFYEFDKDKNMYFIKEFTSTEKHPMIINSSSIRNELVLLALDEKRLVNIKDLQQATGSVASEGEECLIAVPIYINNQLDGFFAVYDLPFLEYTPSNFDLIKVLTKWLEKSLLYSETFSLLTTNSILNSNLEIYTQQYFKEKIREDFEAIKRYGVKHYLLIVNIENFPFDNPTQKTSLRRLVAEILKASTRKTDVVCEGAEENQFYILVPFIEQDQVSKFKDKVELAFNEHKTSEKLGHLLAVRVELFNLHELNSLDEVVGLG